MGTCNFAYDNILVAVDTDGWDVWEIDYLHDNLGAELEAKLGGCATIEREDGLRSFPGTIVWGMSVENSEGYAYKELKVVVRFGYYSGVNIDYIIEDGADSYAINEKLGTKTLDKKVEVLCRKIARIISSYGTKLIVTARFSNGETMYAKA